MIWAVTINLGTWGCLSINSLSNLPVCGAKTGPERQVSYSRSHGVSHSRSHGARTPGHTGCALQVTRLWEVRWDSRQTPKPCFHPQAVSPITSLFDGASFCV